MPKEVVLFNNTKFAPVVVAGCDFSNGKSLQRHLERDGNGVKIVEDGVVDNDALIQSEKINAGLENILKMQTMRYGTLENAIARNKDKQVFADVSHIPTSIGEQAEYVQNIQNDVDALCAKLGISKEDLLKSNQESLTQLLAAKQAAAQAPATETGGNE